MNFLAKTIGTLTGTAIPYSFNEPCVLPICENPSSRSIWKVYDGVSDKDSTPVTIFEFDLKNPANYNYITNAKNALKKHKALSLLPGVLTVFETIENDRTLYLITERASSLAEITTEISPASAVLAIYQITTGLKFINVEGSCLHGNLRDHNVFITDSGEWKIGGFEFAFNYQDNAIEFPALYASYPALTFQKGMIISPEFESFGSDCFRTHLKGGKSLKFDSYLLGLLSYQISHNRSPASNEVKTQYNNWSFEGIPINKLLSPNVGLRMTTEQFLGNGETSYFGTPEIVAYSKFSHISIVSLTEKLEIFKALASADISAKFLDFKVMPEIKNVFDITTSNEGNIQTILLYLMFLIYKNSNEESKSFEIFFKPTIFKAFTLSDRAIRTILLKILPHVIENITKYEVQDKIYPNLVTGFLDTDLTIRTETLLSISYVMDKITERQLNNDLLRYLAKLQVDPNPKLRANTVVCLNKISSKMQSSTRIGVLITAFGKALKDTDYVTRLCAVRGFESSIEYFTPEICCSKVLSSLSPALLDESSVIREEAEKTFEIYMQKIRAEAASIKHNEEDDHIEVDVSHLSNLMDSISLENLGNSILETVSTLNTPSGTPFPESRMNSKNNLTRLQSASTENVVNKAFGVSDDFDDFDGDDGWDVDDDEIENAKPVVSKQSSFNKPKSAFGATVQKQETNTINKPSTINKKSMVLGKNKPVTKINLNLQPKVEEDDDGWGDGW